MFHAKTRRRKEFRNALEPNRFVQSCSFASSRLGVNLSLLPKLREPSKAQQPIAKDVIHAVKG